MSGRDEMPETRNLVEYPRILAFMNVQDLAEAFQEESIPEKTVVIIYENNINTQQDYNTYHNLRAIGRKHKILVTCLLREIVNTCFYYQEGRSDMFW